MMTELSLNILDVVQNSIKANADLIEISVLADTAKDSLAVEISDNGHGMNEEQLQNVTDPFFTTRKTRSVGLGVSFFKQAAEITGGSFTIKSENTGKTGTYIKAEFILSSIDRLPLGDMTATIETLISCNPDLDFIYRYSVNGREFILSTVEMRGILDDIPLNSPEVSDYIKDFLKTNSNLCNELLNETVL